MEGESFIPGGVSHLGSWQTYGALGPAQTYSIRTPGAGPAVLHPSLSQDASAGYFPAA